MSGQPSEIDNDGLRAIIEADPLTTQKIGEELNVSRSTVIWCLKQIMEEKKPNKWVACKLKIKKIIVLKCHLFSAQQRTISQSDAMKSGFYITTSSSSDWTNKKLQSTSQSQTCTKKSHGHCLVVCCQSDPL